MLWTHTQPAILDAGKQPAILAAAVIIPALANLAEAATAIQSIVAEQGMQRYASPGVCLCVTSSWAHWRVGTDTHVDQANARNCPMDLLVIAQVDFHGDCALTSQLPVLLCFVIPHTVQPLIQPSQSCIMPKILPGLGNRCSAPSGHRVKGNLVVCVQS